MTANWNDFLQKIQQELKSPCFLRQPTISKTVHPNLLALAAKYADAVDSQWLEKTIDPPIGCPFADPHSVCTTQQLYTIRLLKEHLGVFLPESEEVFEVGGGYGNLYRVVRNLGFDGDYNIIDFETMHNLQNKYLSQVFPDTDNLNYRTLSEQNLTPQTNNSVFVAAFSYSEMPLKDRVVMEQSLKHHKHFVICYNKAFGGVDNLQYFEKLKNSLTDFDVINFKCNIYSRAWYLLGTRNV
jgi:hypothetical protein